MIIENANNFSFSSIKYTNNFQKHTNHLELQYKLPDRACEPLDFFENLDHIITETIHAILLDNYICMYIHIRIYLVHEITLQRIMFI